MANPLRFVFCRLAAVSSPLQFLSIPLENVHRLRRSCVFLKCIFVMFSENLPKHVETTIEMQQNVLFISKFLVYVTGSAKRYTNAQAMIFLYKRCYSKTRNIFYSLKKIIFGA